MCNSPHPRGFVVHTSSLGQSICFLILCFLQCALPAFARQAPPEKSGLPLMVRVSDIRNLTLGEANRGYPVHVRAVVTYYYPPEGDLFIQDASTGIWVNLDGATPALQSGQLVEVTGITEAPDFAPQIGKPQIRVLGRAPMPAPKRVTFASMASTEEDSQWVEIEGIVHRVVKQGDALMLDVAEEGGRLKLEIANFRGSLPTNLVDVKIRAQGACGTLFNTKNQYNGVLVHSPDISQLRVEEEAPSDPFSVLGSPLGGLLRFTPTGSSGHRVRVQGVVTFQLPGKAVFIKEGNDSLMVGTEQNTLARPGEVVEAVGFPALGEYSAILEDAVFRPLNTVPKPVPIVVTAAEALNGSHDADLVRIQGQFLEMFPNSGSVSLNMRAVDNVFVADLANVSARTVAEKFEPGSLLQLTGICLVHADPDHNPQTFRILIPSLNEVEVLKAPPLGTAKNLIKIIAFVCALLLIFMLWTALLRRQVAHKTEALREGLRREAAARVRYQDLFENANDMVFTCDLEGRLISLNKVGRRLTGLALLEPDKVSLAQILAPQFSGMAPQILQEAGQETQRDYEVEISTTDGRRTRVDLGTRLIHREGDPEEILGIGRDITKRRQLEDQLRHSQKMEATGRLAGGVAHDFNNLLTIISGFGQLVRGKLSPTDPNNKYLADILGAADRGAALTRQLLSFSRQQVLQLQVLDLNTLLLNIESMLRRLIGEDVELVIIPGERLGQVKADPAELDQVILNLAVNARDAMPHGGKLTLHTENVEFDESLASAHYPLPPGRFVMLSVSDTGHGMDAETKKRIFEPFFTTKEQGKGTGLGLATVHGIVNQCGGHICVYSELGEGTCLKVYFPRVDQVADRPKPRPALERHEGGTETILLVEDEEKVRELSMEILKGYGYTVIPATRPDEALEISAQDKGPIDLLLTDVVMPGMSGVELAERLKPGHPRMKVLYVSGYTADAVTRRGVSHSDSVFLQKPFAPDALVRKVREALGVASS
jgi:PAS domain S-box-containing protein